MSEMPDILARICADKRQHVAQCRTRKSEADHLAQASLQGQTRGFIDALRQKTADGQFGLIAEIKKASPSGGLIRPDFDPPSLAKAYEAAGAACLSVLTDTPYFQGQDEYVDLARKACKLPALRKDFMLTPYQICESRALGADCVLLIMACLDDYEATDLAATAEALNMDVLVEVHDEKELDRALALGAILIGINNRNLKTMVTDIGVTETLAALVPEGRMLVSESGLKTNADLHRMALAGARCFLVGESLMRQDDVTAATKELLDTA
jgi:indole-3-glycerol phosphate synthase